MQRGTNTLKKTQKLECDFRDLGNWGLPPSCQGPVPTAVLTRTSCGAPPILPPVCLVGNPPGEPSPQHKAGILGLASAETPRVTEDHRAGSEGLPLPPTP